MSTAFNVHIVSLPLAPGASTEALGWTGNDITGHVLRAPLAGEGGGLTILRAYAVNGAATSGGTSFALQLENWGTSGTAIKVTGGVVAAAIGGTGDHWAANTPKAFALGTTTRFIAAGEWLVLRKTETNSSDPTRGVVVVEYVMGR
jgi:hypothetical protein